MIPAASVDVSDEQAVRRGIHANRLLSDEVLVEAIQNSAATFYSEWMNGQTVPDREAAWAKMHALEVVQASLRAFVSEGEYAGRKKVDE